MKATYFRLALFLGMLLGCVQLANAQSSQIDVIDLTQQDLNQDGNPDLTLIHTRFATDNDTIYVYDRGGDMVSSSDWKTATDFENDLWLFDVGSTSRAEFILSFQQEAGGLVADLYDDRDGDGAVSFSGYPSLRINESDRSTVRVIAPDGWWIRDELINFNIDIFVDGPVEAAFGFLHYINYINPKLDGIYEHVIHVRDADNDGRPDSQWTDIDPPVPEQWSINRGEVMVNVDDDEPLIEGSVFWPYLGGTLFTRGPVGRRPKFLNITQLPTAQPRQGFLKSYGVSHPPIQIAWEQSAIGTIGEFVASRFNDNNWFMYSRKRLFPDQIILPNFESPFVFKDAAADNDSYPELLTRFFLHQIGDVSFRRYSSVNASNNRPIQLIRYSWDQDNNQSWDFTLNLVGEHVLDNSTLLKAQDLQVQTIPPENITDWVNDHTWDGVTFAASERNFGWNSEGFKEYQISEAWTYLYHAGNLIAPPFDAYREAEIGVRGELSFDFGQKPTLYVSPIDSKLHLKHADYGTWNIDGIREIRYEDVNNDGYFDHWQRFVNDELDYEFYRLGGYIIYVVDDIIHLYNDPLPLALHEAPPPRDHETWQEWQMNLAQWNSISNSAAPTEETGNIDIERFGDPILEIDSAGFQYPRANGSAFRAILTLDPQFAVRNSSNSVLPDEPGFYIISNGNVDDPSSAVDTLHFEPVQTADVIVNMTETDRGFVQFIPSTLNFRLTNPTNLDIHNAVVTGLVEGTLIYRNEFTLLAGTDQDFHIDWGNYWTGTNRIDMTVQIPADTNPSINEDIVVNFAGEFSVASPPQISPRLLLSAFGIVDPVLLVGLAVSIVIMCGAAALLVFTTYRRG